jgi:hypothetical protein
MYLGRLTLGRILGQMYLINDLERLIRGEHLIIYFGETKER